MRSIQSSSAFEMNHLIVFFVCLSMVNSLLATSSVQEIIDQDDIWRTSDEVRSIVTAICDGKALRITRTHTASLVVSYLIDDVGYDRDNLLSCYIDHEAALRQLREMIKLFYIDPCSLEIVRVIQQFGDRHLQDPKESSESKQGRELKALPPTLKNFFVHFATEVSDICRRQLPGKFESEATKLSATSPIYSPGSHFDAALSQINVPQSADLSAVPLMIWDFEVMDLKLARDNPNDDETEAVLKAIQPKPDADPYSIFVKVKSAESFHAIQQTCESKFRPIYSKTILPLERLADAGLMAEPIDVASKPLARHWYKVAQVCEYIRRIGYVSDSTLDDGQMLIVSRREATKSPEYKSQLERLNGQESRVEFEFRVAERVYQLQAALHKDPEHLIESMNEEVAKRAENIAKVATNYYETARAQVARGQAKVQISEVVTGKKRLTMTFKKPVFSLLLKKIKRKLKSYYRSARMNMHIAFIYVFPSFNFDKHYLIADIRRTYREQQ